MSNFSNSISIVIATYNGERYLKEQLNSIVAQTLKPTQVIIQDDASTDNTVAIIQEYSAILPIELTVNTHNLGYIGNFQSALSKATGEYIALCDQDDIWEHNKLQSLFEAIGNNALVYSDSLLVDSNGHYLGKTLSQKLKNTFISTSSPLSFLYDNCISAHAMLFHHSLLPKLFPFPKHLYFDAWIASNAASNGGVHYFDKPLVRYRQHSSNTLSQVQKSSVSASQQIALKTDKKVTEHASRVSMIDELLTIPSLTNDEKRILNRLREGHLSFQNRWFNREFFILLIQNRRTLFAITKRNAFILSFKKALGLKLYALFPFL